MSQNSNKPAPAKATPPAKTAPPTPPSVSQLADQQRNYLISRLLLAAGGAGLLGIGLGAGNQLVQYMKRRDISEGPIDETQQDVQFYYPQKKKPQLKQANFLDLLGRRATGVANYFRGMGQALPNLRSVTENALETTPGKEMSFTQLLKEHPYALPIGLSMAGLSAVGGYSLANSAGKQLREFDYERQVDEAQDEYERALLGQYPHDSNTKKANTGLSLSDLWKLAPLYAIPAFTAAGYYGYTSNKKRQSDTHDHILRRRAMLRLLESPPETHFLPMAMDDKDEDGKRRR